MARSKYIYIVKKASSNFPPLCEFLGAFTVKHEAILWALQNGWSPECAYLFRAHDGMHNDKTLTPIPWTKERAT